MAANFMKLYKYILDIKQDVEYIDHIIVENTSNVSKDFSNIRIRTKIKFHGINLFLVKESDLTEEQRSKITKYRNLDIHYHYESDEYLYRYRTWESLVHAAFDIYDDLLEIFELNKFTIPLKINILGCSDKWNALKRAEEKDMFEFMNGEGFKILCEDKLRKVTGAYVNRICDIERVIKNQKKAYLLSKMVENKCHKSEYEKYPDLIDAYDTLMDIKKRVKQIDTASQQ